MPNQRPSGAGFTRLSTLPLTPAYAKRLTALLGVCDSVGVIWQGYRLQAVECKRYPYDEWHRVELSGQIDTTNQAVKYRAVLKWRTRHERGLITMKQAIYEHPTSGVFFHIEYVPATKVSKHVIQDVRLASTDYGPVGPNLMEFLHETYIMDTSGNVNMATPLLQAICEELL